MAKRHRIALSLTIALPWLTHQEEGKAVIEYASPKTVKSVREAFYGAGLDPVQNYIESQEELADGFPEPAVWEAQTDQYIVDNLHFDGFVWGAATAAYQVEGAWNKGHRDPSIWDRFSQGGHTFAGHTGNDADDFYYYWPSDVARLKNLGFNGFRMSISWTRVVSQGRDGKQYVNDEGVAYYKAVFAELIRQGIKPVVTLYHWDLPYNMDWLDKGVVQQFVDYADFCFKTFPEVLHWTTFNEPWTFCQMGYGTGEHAPGIKDEASKFLCGHHVLLAHAYAVDDFRKYHTQTGSTINIVLNVAWGYPKDPSSAADREACQLYLDDSLGWFADPVYISGEYPGSLRARYGSLIPRFSGPEVAVLHQSFEGPFGLNIYSAVFVHKDSHSKSGYGTGDSDANGNKIGVRADSPWLLVVPQAAYDTSKYIWRRYRAPILVTENGCDEPGENNRIALKDTFRIDYYRKYLSYFAKAQSEGIKIVGYFAWSLLDNFEWADGFFKRFGLYRVDYYSKLRFPKFSARWFARLMKLAAQPEAVQPDVPKLKSMAPALIKQWGIMEHTGTPGVQDLEVMPAANILQVKQRCLEIDCDGFEVKDGQAHLKPALSIVGGRHPGLHNYQTIPGSKSTFYLLSMPDRPGQPEDVKIQMKASDFNGFLITSAPTWHRSVGYMFMASGLLSISLGLAAALRRQRSMKPNLMTPLETSSPGE